MSRDRHPPLANDACVVTAFTGPLKRTPPPAAPNAPPGRAPSRNPGHTPHRPSRPSHRANPDPRFPLRGWLIIAGLALIALILMTIAVRAETPSTHAKPGIDGAWASENGELVVEFGVCGRKKKELCGVITALPGAEEDAELAKYARELCGLPLIWGLTFDEETERWRGGEILDLETEKPHPLEIKAQDETLTLFVFTRKKDAHLSFDWTKTEPSRAFCTQ